MSEELDFYESALSDSLRVAVQERDECFEQFSQVQRLHMECKNLDIRHDIEVQHLNTKVKLVGTLPLIS